MARIPVATLTDHCWEKCPGFDINVEDFYKDDGVYFRTLECKNLELCAYASDATKKEEE